MHRSADLFILELTQNLTHNARTRIQPYGLVELVLFERAIWIDVDADRAPISIHLYPLTILPNNEAIVAVDIWDVVDVCTTRHKTSNTRCDTILKKTHVVRLSSKTCTIGVLLVADEWGLIAGT